jgi:hypothetical protein
MASQVIAGMKERKMKKRPLLALTILLPILLTAAACSRPAIYLTVYNSTKVATGDLAIVSGDIVTDILDDNLEIAAPTFPYAANLSVETPSNQYLVLVTLESGLGVAGSMAVLDTSAEKDLPLTLDLELLMEKGIDSYEPDGSPSLAKPIQIDEVQPRSLDVASDADWASAYLQAGTAYLIETMNNDVAGFECDTVLSLYDPYLLLIESDNDDGEGTASLIRYVPPASGMYYLKVQADAPDDTGSYALGLSTDQGSSAYVANRAKFLSVAPKRDGRSLFIK